MLNTKQITVCLSFILFFLFCLLNDSAIFAQGKPIEEKNNLAKSQEFDPSIFATLNINNLWMWEREDGKSNKSASGKDGVYFPRGTSHVIYQDGIVWGARAYIDENLTIPAPFDQPIRVMGVTYGTGCRAGWVEGFGATAVQVDKDHERARIYRIRRGWKEMSDEALNQDVADCFEIPVSDVTTEQINIILDDYQWCWDNWPVDLGAPFIDRNGNGVYDPPPPNFKVNELIEFGYDEPGVAGADPNLPADMVIWNVYNDLHRSLRFASEPTGMEIQNTVWGYDRTDALADMYFRKVKLINKGGVEIDTIGNKGIFYLDSMYVGQWSDPDIGDSGDDLIGCDTILNLGFAYNSNAIDNKFRSFNLSPPSVGYNILQGPIIPSLGDVAIVDFNFRKDYKNLGITSFAYLFPGNPYADPALPNYKTGVLRWYKMMRGYAPIDGPDVHYKFPPGVKPGPFPFAGDPIVGTGYIDGLSEKSVHMGNFMEEYSFAPGDRRMLCVSGPFQMAPEDTQEVVIALVCGLGADRLSSISAMKFKSIVAQKYYDSLLSLPNVQTSYQTHHPNDSETELRVQVDLRNAPEVTNSEISLIPYYGPESEIKLPLFDDGLHNDSLAGDHLWGNSITQTNRKYPYNGYLILQKTFGQYTIPILENIKIRPSLQLINWRVAWENGRQDSSINSYEKVHLRFDILNTDNVNNVQVLRIENMNINAKRKIFQFKETILPGDRITSESFFLEIDGSSVDDSLSFSYIKIYDYFSEKVTETYPVVPWISNQTWGDTLEVTSEIGIKNKIVPIVADPAQLTGQTYQISFYEKENQLRWQLKDRSTSEIKFKNGQTSNFPYFAHPVIDGIQYRVLSCDSTIESFQCVVNGNGLIDPPESAAADWRDYPTPNDDAPGRNQQKGEGKWLITAHKSGTSNYYTYQDFIDHSFVANGLKAIIPRSFEIRFTISGSKVFDHWGTEKMIDVPFELWDVGWDPDDPSDDYRLFAYMLDVDNNSEFNLVYDASDPNGGSGWADHGVSGGTNDPYTDILFWMSPADNTPGTQGYDKLVAAIEADPAQRPNWDAKPGDAVGDYDAWSTFANMVLVNWNAGDVTAANSPLDYNQAMPEQGTIFRIVTSESNLPGDILYVESPKPKLDYSPNTSYLFQNYPNPFNPVTQIRFHIAKTTNVKLEIFNLLGQKVKTLIDKKMTTGERSIFWNGRNDAGIKLGSGIYFYRLKVGEYLKTKKMTLLK